MTAPYLPPHVLGLQDERPRAVIEAPVADGRESSWWPVVLASIPSAAATVYDAETTFSGMGEGGRELNPIMRPFVNAGRVPTYAALAALMTGQAAGSKYLKDRGSDWWWAPQALTAIGHLVAGRLNQSRGGK